MFNALRKMLGIQTTSRSIKASLFSGSAYFSNQVPRAFTEKWVAHGGEICSGTTLDVRARYFFAIDPSEPWVTKLFAKSVMVIHAGWIVHCVDEDFRVPISEYILDDRFVLKPPYKLTSDFAATIYVPLSDPEEPVDDESGESGSTPVETSDTPSTPTSMPRKRKREQAYFDSPSGSLVFSGFDKDGIPRRPRKQRKLRFDPSFSPGGGRSGREAAQEAGLDLFQGYHASRDDAELDDRHGWDGEGGALQVYSNMMHSPDTADKPRASEGPSTTHQRFVGDKILSKPTEELMKVVSIDKQKALPVRTIDFTKLPPPTRRWHFPEPQDTSTILSIVKATDNKVKTPKKISFADHARLCVYAVPPPRSNAKDGVDVELPRRSSDESIEARPEVSDETRVLSGEAKGSGMATADSIRDVTPLIDRDDLARLSDESQSGDDTLTLTMEEVQAMQQHLLESAAKNGTGCGRLATLFELGKTFHGKAFDHVW